MRKLMGGIVAALIALSEIGLASGAGAFEAAPPIVLAQRSQSSQSQQPAAVDFSGIYEGNVDRRYIAGKRPIATRLYRVAINPDLANGTVWIYEGGKLLYTLLLKGRVSARTFTGTTRPVEGAKGYKPDNVTIAFEDGGSMRWHHADDTLEGHGTLSRK